MVSIFPSSSNTIVEGGVASDPEVGLIDPSVIPNYLLESGLVMDM